MPGPRPSEIERWVRSNCPETITLVLTAHERDAYLAEMIEAGAAGFLHKNEATGPRLIDAIRRAATGSTLFSAEQLARAQRWQTDIASRWHSLTAREREVLALVAKGKTDNEIADELNVGRKTARNHVYQILKKLETKSRTSAALWAVQEGFITLGNANKNEENSS